MAEKCQEGTFMLAAYYTIDTISIIIGFILASVIFITLDFISKRKKLRKFKSTQDKIFYWQDISGMYQDPSLDVKDKDGFTMELVTEKVIKEWFQELLLHHHKKSSPTINDYADDLEKINLSLGMAKINCIFKSRNLKYPPGLVKEIKKHLTEAKVNIDDLIILHKEGDTRVSWELVRKHIIKNIYNSAKNLYVFESDRGQSLEESIKRIKEFTLWETPGTITPLATLSSKCRSSMEEIGPKKSWENFIDSLKKECSDENGSPINVKWGSDLRYQKET